MRNALEKNIVSLAQQGKVDIALKIIKKKFRNSPKEELWLKLGEACRTLGKYDECIKCCAASIQINPQYAQAYSLAAIVYMDAGQQNEASHLVQQALNLDSNDSDILFNAGVVLRRVERYGEAIPYFQQCIDIAPDHALAHSLVGNCFYATGDTRQALFHYKESLEYNPRLEKSLLWLSAHHLSTGDFGAANTCLDKALEISPKSPILLSAQANLFSMMGEKEKAYQIVRKLIDSKCVTALSLDVYFALYPQYGELSELIGLAEGYLGQSTVQNPEKRLLHGALGKVYDFMGEYDRAFEHFKICNDLYFGKFNIESYRSLIDEILDIYDNDYIVDMPKSKGIEAEPIFIVGMPRSGSTLIEQVLSRHSKVFAGGEVPFMNDVVRSRLGVESGKDISFDVLQSLKAQDFEEMATEYLDKMKTVSDGSARMTDKLPTNYLNIGLIMQIFPNAKIIHCRRHPLDICISIYFQDITIFHPYANSLKDTACVYIEYDRLMRHWQAVLGENILDIAYEDVVADLEGTVRRLLEFCRLDWEEDCLEFYAEKRNIATASFNQVNRPIYSKSVGRWMNYESHLGEIEDILEPLIK